jgi:hypothetical protein
VQKGLHQGWLLHTSGHHVNTGEEVEVAAEEGTVLATIPEVDEAMID